MPGVAVDVGGGPGIGTLRHHTRRGAGEDARAQVEGQPVGQGARERIAQGAVAAGGNRERHGRSREVDNEDQVHHRRDAERRRGVGVVVGDRDGDGVSGGDAAVAAHCMGNRGRGVPAVVVLACGDRDGLGDIPGVGRQGQGTGDGDQALDRDGWRHRHVAGGGGLQSHGIGGHAAFGDGKVFRRHDDPVRG